MSRFLDLTWVSRFCLFPRQPSPRSSMSQFSWKVSFFFAITVIILIVFAAFWLFLQSRCTSSSLQWEQLWQRKSLTTRGSRVSTRLYLTLIRNLMVRGIVVPTMSRYLVQLNLSIDNHRCVMTRVLRTPAPWSLSTSWRSKIRRLSPSKMCPTTITC